MDKPAQNIQDSFLNTARKEKIPITIFLLSGVKLIGWIRSFDKYCLVLESGNLEQLIFKHAVSTIIFQRSVLRDIGERHAVLHSSPLSPGAAPAAAALVPAHGADTVGEA